MKMFSMGTVARNGNCLFRRFRPIVAFEGTQNNARRLINKRDDYETHRKRVVYEYKNNSYY
jgi:hypothetical protein